jgi:hypothetical protein
MMPKPPVKVTDPKVLAAIREYDRVRAALIADSAALRDYATAESRRLDNCAKLAIAKISVVLTEAGIVESNENFGVETRYLELFGDAYILFLDESGNTDGSPTEPRTLN